MADLLMADPEPKPKKKKAKRKKMGGVLSPKVQGINVHVNVVNQAGDGHKKSANPTDEALTRLRGY